MSATRGLVRFAVRDAMRNKFRTILNVVLVAVPVAFILLVATLIRIPYIEADTSSLYGASKAILTPYTSGRDIYDPANTDIELPEDISSVALDATVGASRSGDDLLRLRITNNAVFDPIAKGMAPIISGATPTQADEAVITTSLKDAYGVEVGGQIRVEGVGLLTVTGIAKNSDWGGFSVYLGTDYLPPEATDTRSGFSSGRTLLLDGSDEAIANLANLYPADVFNSVASVQVRGMYSDLAQRAPGSSDLAAGLGAWGALACGSFAVVIGASFVASIRRQLRTVGLLGTNGASLSHVRKIFLVQAFVTSLLGVGLGVPVSVLFIRLLRPHVYWAFGSQYDSLHVSIFDAAAAAGVAVVIACVAAWIPVWAATRIPMRVALAGRRTTTRIRLVYALASVAIFASGVLALKWIASGPGGPSRPWGFATLGCGLVLLGGGMLAPWLFSRLGLLAPLFSGSTRIALRSISSARSRCGALAAAMMALVALGSGLAVYMTVTDSPAVSYEDGDFVEQSWPRNLVTARVLTREDFSNRPIPPSGADSAALDDAQLEKVREVIGGFDSVTVSQPYLPRVGEDRERYTTMQYASLAFYDIDLESNENLCVGNEDSIGIVGGGSESSRQALREGKAVVFDPSAIVDGQIEISIPSGGVDRNAQLVKVDAVLDTTMAPSELGALAIIPDSMSQQLGLMIDGSQITFLRTNSDLTFDQIAKLQDLTVDDSTYADYLAGTAEISYMDIRTSGQSDLPTLAWQTDIPVSLPTYPHLSRVLLTILGSLVLGISAVGLALAALEDRDERQMLGLLGSSNFARRNVSGLTALFTVAVGIALAIPVAGVPTYVLLRPIAGTGAQIPYVLLTEFCAALLVGSYVMGATFMRTKRVTQLAIRE